MKILITFTFSLVLATAAFAEDNGNTKQDTVYAIKSEVPVIIDGNDIDACWQKPEAEWFLIDEVWLGGTMSSGDFEGKYKVSWDENYLYLLVYVIDDSLSDDHTDPVDNFWNDDCVEIFIDEDNSGGDHQYNFNAFAYHVSTYYDAIDLGTDRGAHLLNDNLHVAMDTIEENTYLWEFAFNMFDATFKPGGTNTPLPLVLDQVLGLSLAYCDNDETDQRENFIGSTYKSTNEDIMWQNASYFGTCKLVNEIPEWTDPNSTKVQEKGYVNVFPNPAKNDIYIHHNQSMESHITVFNVFGSQMADYKTNPDLSTIHLDVSAFPAGIYFLQMVNERSKEISKVQIIR